MVGTVGLEPTFRRTRPLNVRVCQFRHIPKTLNIISNIFSKCNNNLQFFQFNFKIFCFSLDTINFVCYNHNVFVCTQIADYLNPETFGIVETKTAIFHKYFGELPKRLRGHPAKVLDRETGARVQISHSPPKANCTHPRENEKCVQSFYFI